ncbi:MAG TPA: hypothetical protein V6C76_13025 [Drouetiella sp.]
MAAIFQEFQLDDGNKLVMNIEEIKYLFPVANNSDICEIQTKDDQKWIIADSYKSVKKTLQK